LAWLENGWILWAFWLPNATFLPFDLELESKLEGWLSQIVELNKLKISFLGFYPCRLEIGDAMLVSCQSWLTMSLLVLPYVRAQNQATITVDNITVGKNKPIPDTRRPFR